MAPKMIAFPQRVKTDIDPAEALIEAGVNPDNLSFHPIKAPVHLIEAPIDPLP